MSTTIKKSINWKDNRFKVNPDDLISSDIQKSMNKYRDEIKLRQAIFHKITGKLPTLQNITKYNEKTNS